MLYLYIYTYLLFIYMIDVGWSLLHLTNPQIPDNFGWCIDSPMFWIHLEATDIHLLSMSCVCVAGWRLLDKIYQDFIGYHVCIWYIYSIYLFVPSLPKPFLFNYLLAQVCGRTMWLYSEEMFKFIENLYKNDFFATYCQKRWLHTSKIIDVFYPSWN